MNEGLERVFIALDKMSDKQAFAFLKQHQPFPFKLKVGMEMFYAYGRDFVEKLAHEFGREIFLDLKLYDIPHTCFHAVKSLSTLPVNFLTIHLSGGKTMAREVIKARNDFCPKLKVLGVTHLTSLDESDFLTLWGLSTTETEQSFYKMVAVAEEEKLDGLILPAEKISTLKNSDLLKISPGIRFQDDPAGDQKKVMDPQQAFSLGADYLVMGRSLTQASNPAERLQELSR